MLDDDDERMDAAWFEALAACPECFEAKRRLGYFPPSVIAVYSAIYRDGELTPAEYAAVRTSQSSVGLRSRHRPRPVVTLAPL